MGDVNSLKPGKKEQILAKATELFFASGVADVSMDDIAAAVPVAKMTIYNHFRSKDRLVGAVMERYVREQHDIMNRKIEESPDTLSALVSILDYQSIPVVPERFIRESLELYPHIVTELLEYYRSHIHDQLRGLIVRGQEEGVIRRELSPHILMVYMQGLTEFFARPDVLAQFHDLRLLGEQFRTMFLFGIAAPKGE
jgi:AcrR family transcriptional regulator